RTWRAMRWNRSPTRPSTRPCATRWAGSKAARWSVSSAASGYGVTPRPSNRSPDCCATRIRTWPRPPRGPWATSEARPPWRPWRAPWIRLRPPINARSVRACSAAPKPSRPAVSATRHWPSTSAWTNRRCRSRSATGPRAKPACSARRKDPGCKPFERTLKDIFSMSINRRDALRLALAAAGLGAAGSRPACADSQPRALPEATPRHLPRWRGFNLLNKFMAGQQSAFEVRDFADIAELGFDFVRLPLDYRCWTDRANPRTLLEPVLKEIDQALQLGRKHGIHVQINFHRAPGYTVAKPPERKSLWTDPEVLDVCAHHWASFAARYQGIPNNQVSFNLFNEPDDQVKPEDYRRVVERVAAAIRERDPQRLIVCDGRGFAT